MLPRRLMDSRLFLIKPKDLTAFTFQISSNRRALSYNIDGTDDFLKEAAKNLHSNSALRRQSGSATSNDQMPIPLRKRKGAKKWSDLPGSKRTTGVGHFVDWKRARVSGGDGGDGGLSLASLFANEMAGPDGGDGGNGGHVIFQASRDVHSLDKVPSLITAESGVPGKGSKCDGKNAKHLTVHVPVGTVFRNTETREILCELVDEEAIFLAAKGGAGGKGNHYFKSSTNQAPKVAEAGGKGECFIYEIELRTMAHFGLIGFPNAGKSTFLRSISRARPKVASYPFTTLNPHVGMVLFDDCEQLSVADIPGIIQGAHEDKGLGIEFLRHIDRCLCLLYVIDLSQPNPLSQLEILKFELEQYLPGLSKRPHAIVGNKIDLDEAAENVYVIEEFSKSSGTPCFPISGKLGLNVTDVLHFMRQKYDENQIAERKLKEERIKKAEEDMC